MNLAIFFVYRVICIVHYQGKHAGKYHAATPKYESVDRLPIEKVFCDASQNGSCQNLRQNNEKIENTHVGAHFGSRQ